MSTRASVKITLKENNKNKEYNWFINANSFLYISNIKNFFKRNQNLNNNDFIKR
jgi:hypothetical protein